MNIQEARGVVAEQGGVAVEAHRAGKEVEGQIVMAKRYPRDQNAATTRIMQACQRPKLAEQAIYSFPRGGSQVTGPSIRLAEVMAQNWGNIAFGIRELSRNHGASEMQAYCWDLETNVFVERKFTSRHVRDGKGGKTTELTGERDIYEITANQGARRLRACILEIIPGDVQDSALETVEKTLRKQDNRPLEVRIQVMLKVFEHEFGVTKEMIEKRIGHITTAISETEIVQLQGIYQTLKNEAASIESFFPAEEGAASSVPTPTAEEPAKEEAPEPPKSETAALNQDEEFSRIRTAINRADTQYDLDILFNEVTSGQIKGAKVSLLKSLIRGRETALKAGPAETSGDFE